MAGNREQTIVGAVGGTMLTFAVACFSLRLTEWSANHHALLTVGIIVGFGGAAIAVLRWLLIKDGSVADPVGLQLQMAPRGDVVESPQIGTVYGDVHFSHRSSREAPHATPAKLVPSLPNLTWKAEFRYVEYVPGHAAWRSLSYPSPGCKEALLVGVTNPMPGLGQSARKIDDVSAHIVFSTFVTTQKIAQPSVSRSYWLNRPANELSVDVGTTEWIVVCLDDYGQWVSYVNARKEVSENEPFYDPFFPVGEKVPIPRERIVGLIGIDISLYSSSLGQAVGVKRYSLERVARGWSVKELDTPPQKVALSQHPPQQDL